MIKNIFVACMLVTAVFVACGAPPQSPTSPSTALPAITAAESGHATLKASVPTPLSPTNNVKVDSLRPTLTITNATATHAPVTLLHRFQVIDETGAVVAESDPISPSGDTTSYTPTSDLADDKPFQWRARAEHEGRYGEWSSAAGFVTPELSGYIRGAELYDPLIDGKTVGQIHGNVQFIPGVGVKLLDVLSYISYELPQTLFEGEYSLIVTNLGFNTEGDKTKVMAMAEGYSDIITNNRRMTVEKRGDPPGIIAWRFITHGDQVDTEGAERVEYKGFNESLDYFFRVTWRNNFFNVLIREGGVNGRAIYDRGKHFDGRPYDPIPHVIYVGSPVGRSGPSAATIENTIYRQVWVSARPRPAYAK